MHIQLNHEAVQLITGHGAFKGYLFEHNKCDSEEYNNCPGHIDGPQHVLILCPEHEQDRTALKQLTERTGLRWPVELRVLIQNNETFKEITKLWRTIRSKINI